MAWARTPAWQEWSAACDQPAPVRLRRTGRKGSGLHTAALAGGVALVALLGLASLVVPPGHSPIEPPVATPSQPLWRDIDRPFQLFALAASPYARLPMAYTARRRTTGSDREDWLTFGDSARPGAMLRLVISRRGAASLPADLVVDYARLAATAGHALTRAGLPFTLQTRFGGFDTAELTLRTGELTRACLGFRLQGAAGPIGIIGLACSDPEHPPDRSSLACAIDRIDLVAAGEDGAMRSFFAGVDRRRDLACGGGPTVYKGAATASGGQAARGT